MALEDVLAATVDPELGRSLGELSMIGGVEEGRRRAEVTINLPGPGYPATSGEELRQRIETAIASGGGPRSVSIRFEIMDEDSQRRLAARLTAERDGGEGDGTSTQAGSVARRLGPGVRVLGISSGKGGVGKSSITVNLAIELSRRGRSVAILDADVYGFSVPAMLGIVEPPMVIDRLLVPPRRHGVRCLSMGYFIPDEQPVIWRGPMLHKALEQFLTDAWWGDPDFVLVDMPPGTGDVTLTMAEYLPVTETIVVTTPQRAAARVAQRSAYAARKLRLPLRGVIENMSWFTGDDGARYELFGSGGGQELADTLGVPLLGQVPLVPAIREGGDTGLPVTVANPGGEAARAFARIAEAVESLRAPRRYSSELRVQQA